ncbi:phosphatase PAP2 family protein [Phaeovulum sp. W22_SRMD_FR3]|uniref:phosphatase PAP2 family protein n=1 Tax=Phaeovulum sp. W22_SRMD_FR3 TaxID=3240274 RepID=UPI003F9EB124
MPSVKADLLRLRLWLAFVLVLAIFTLWPGLDLWVSGLFYRADGGFWLAGNQAMAEARQQIWDLVLLVLVVALAASLVCCWRRGKALWGVPRRVWLFVVALYLVGPGIVVNLILKSHWGRARPADVLEFGGSAHFTAPLERAGQCLHNCSFVSGEGAGVTALAISLMVILSAALPRLHRGDRIAAQVILGVLVAVGAGMRVMTGRHFLSDTLLSMLIVCLLAEGLGRLILTPEPGALTALRARISALFPRR